MNDINRYENLRCSRGLNIILDGVEQGLIKKAEESNKYAVVTPLNIACDMVRMLPEELFVPETKFLDPFCKSGIFLRAIKNRLFYSRELEIAFPNKMERASYINDNQLYGLCMNWECFMASEYVTYGRVGYSANEGLREIDNLVSIIKDKERFREVIRKEFGDMKFDVILGNPPYNNELYIDMILAFREQIVPYMDRIVYFKDSGDVFDIKEAGGISYYLIDKKEHDTKLVKNECSKGRVFLSDWEIHKESPLILSTQTIVNMINKVKHIMPISIDIECKYSKYVRYDEWGNSERKNADDVEIIQSGSVVGYIPRNRLNTLDGLDKYKVVMHMMNSGSLGKGGSGHVLNPAMILGKNQIPKGSYTILADFDSGGKALSLKTYVSTKFTRFLYFIGESGTSMQSEFWRNVPAIDDYDTIYEDRPMNGYIPNNNGEYIDNKGIKHCSLYIKYKLTSDEIDMIESVIKDRLN